MSAEVLKVTTFHPRCHVLMSVVLDGRGGPDTEPLLIEATPKAASVSLNGYHEADTWTLDFDARSLPFDPEIVRSAAVVIYMYAATGTDDDREWAVPEFERVRGLCDESKLSFSIDGGRMVSMSGRDYTGLLLDVEWDPRKRIPSGLDLRRTVKLIADAAAPPGALQRFDVVFISRFGAAPIVGAARRSTKKKGLWVKPGKSYWDVIYEMVLHEGYIVFVRGEQIVITDPRTQTETSSAKSPRMAAGINLASLDVSRKLAKERVPQIVLTSYDPTTKQHIEVTYPTRHDSAPTTSLGTKKDEVMYLPGPAGIRDRATLLRMARVRYDNMARAESVYRFETLALTALDGEDLLQLVAGSPIRIGFDPFNSEEMRSLNTAQREEHLLALGYSPRLSAFIAAYFDRIDQFRQAYYTRLVELKWSTSDGLRVTVEAVNYAYEPRELAEAA